MGLTAGVYFSLQFPPKEEYNEILLSLVNINIILTLVASTGGASNPGGGGGANCPGGGGGGATGGGGGGTTLDASFFDSPISIMVLFRPIALVSSGMLPEFTRRSEFTFVVAVWLG